MEGRSLLVGKRDVGGVFLYFHIYVHYLYTVPWVYKFPTGSENIPPTCYGISVLLVLPTPGSLKRNDTYLGVY